MNLFNILGYVSDKQYSDISKSNVGVYALVAGAAPSGTLNVFFGANNPTNIYYGTALVQSIYYGSTLVWQK